MHILFIPQKKKKCTSNEQKVKVFFLLIVSERGNTKEYTNQFLFLL